MFAAVQKAALSLESTINIKNMKVVNCDKRQWNVKLRTGAMVQEGGGFMRIRECCRLFQIWSKSKFIEERLLNFEPLIWQIVTIMMNGKIVTCYVHSMKYP